MSTDKYPSVKKAKTKTGYKTSSKSKSYSKSGYSKSNYSKSKYVKKPEEVQSRSYKDCTKCSNYEDGICVGSDRESFAVSSIYIAASCKYYNPREDIDPNKIPRVCFVEMDCQNWKQVKGKFVANGKSRMKGLKVDEEVLLFNGKKKLLSSKSNQIVATYDYIPSWATEELIDIYNKEQG